MTRFLKKISASFLILLAVAICLASYANAETQYSDLPPPPIKPEKFTSKQQLKEYLVKLHEYYAIIGRPRFGKRSNTFLFRSTEPEENSSESFSELVPVNVVIEKLDPNQNGFISKEDFINFINWFNKRIN